eukprot:7231061-Pyramimonas_sp.AAC.1
MCIRDRFGAVPCGPLSYSSKQQSEWSEQADLTAEVYQRVARQDALPVEYAQRARPESQRGADQSPQRGEGLGHGGHVRSVPDGPLTARTVLGGPLASAARCDHGATETEPRTVS